MAFRRAETLLCPLLMSSPSQTLTPYKGVYVIEGDIISPQIPDTDPDGQAFRRWSEVAETASGAIGQPFYVSPLLERQATADQKERKIDLLDHLFEGGGLKPPNTSFEASKRPV